MFLLRGLKDMYKKIALATDGSEHSRRAAEHAMNLASNSEDSKIHVIYVVDPNKVISDVLDNWNSGDPGQRHKEKSKDFEMRAKEAKVNFEVTILHGDPGPTIVQFINENNFEIVIIGSRGVNRLQEFVLGSVSHKVAKRANCPVLIVK